MTTRKRKAFIPESTPQLPSGEGDADADADADAGTSVSEFYSQVVGHHPTSSSAQPPLPTTSPPSPTHGVFCDTCQELISSMHMEEHKTTSLHLFNCQHKPNPIKLPETNKGYQMLRDKMGWNENEGLGVNSQGRREPVAAVQKRDRKGVGNKTPSSSSSSAASTHSKKRIKATHNVEETVSRRERQAKEVYEKTRDHAIRDIVYNDFEYLTM